MIFSAAILTTTSVAAAPAATDAASSDPIKMGWMVGAPPAVDRTLRPYDMKAFQFPAMRWSASNFRQLMPTVNVSRGLGAPIPLQENLRVDIDAVSFTPLGSTQPMSWAESLAANYTDGIVVLHRGNIIYERYFGALKKDGQPRGHVGN